MSNHYHVVLHINIAKNQSWSDREVCERWHKLFKDTLLAQKFLRDEPLKEAERQALNAKIGQWRVNLSMAIYFNPPLAIKIDPPSDG